MDLRRIANAGTRWTWIASAIVFACILAISATYLRQKHPAKKPSTGNAFGYADAGTCTACHQKEATGYAITGMSRSFATAVTDEIFSGAPIQKPFEHSSSGNRYSLRKEGSKWFMSRTAATGETDERRIDYVIGSGNHARTFLHRTEGGKLIELPVSWYSELGGSWNMSPGYDNKHPQDFQRSVGYECMYCHNGFPDMEQQTPELTETAIWKGKLASGIDCQRCHGPGAAHVRAASSAGFTLDQIRSSIVNPAKLDRSRQLSVCLQCHLETTSLRLPNSIPRFEKDPFSFRPGQLLEENTLFFDHMPQTGYDDRFEVAHQGYRLQKSACFRKSNMTCSTCHDPHNTYRGTSAVQHYVQACTSCHTSVHPAILRQTSKTCLDCHMPRRRAEDAVHVVMTDHYIQRRPSTMDPNRPIAEAIPDYRGRVMFYQATPGGIHPNSADAQLYTALAQIAQDSNPKDGVAEVNHVLRQSPSRRPEPYYILGAAYARLGDRSNAIAALKESLQRDPNFKPALREIATVYENAGDINAAIVAGEASVNGITDDTSLRNLADIYLRAHRSAEAERALTQALAIDSGNSASHNLLGVIRIQEKEVDGAESEFRNALQADPNNNEARNNLASLLAGKGDIGAALVLVRTKLEHDADNAVLQKTYANLLASSGNTNEAVLSLRSALMRNPRAYDLHVALADIFMASSLDKEAATEYLAATRLKNDSAESHVGLASAYANLNRIKEAQHEFEVALSIDPNNLEANVSMARLLLAQHKDMEAARFINLLASSPDLAVRQQAFELSSHTAGTSAPQ